jgi:hypothetical protein
MDSGRHYSQHLDVNAECEQRISAATPGTFSAVSIFPIPRISLVVHEAKYIASSIWFLQETSENANYAFDLVHSLQL